MSGSRKLATSAIWTGFEKQSTVTGEDQGRPGKTLSSAMLKPAQQSPTRARPQRFLFCGRPEAWVGTAKGCRDGSCCIFARVIRSSQHVRKCPRMSGVIWQDSASL